MMAIAPDHGSTHPCRNRGASTFGQGCEVMLKRLAPWSKRHRGSRLERRVAARPPGPRPASQRLLARAMSGLRDSSAASVHPETPAPMIASLEGGRWRSGTLCVEVVSGGLALKNERGIFWR